MMVRMNEEINGSIAVIEFHWFYKRDIQMMYLILQKTNDDDAVLFVLFIFMQERNGHVYFRMNSMRSRILYGWIDRLLCFEMLSPLFVSSLWLMVKLELSVGSFLSFFISSVSYYVLNRMILLQREWIRKTIWMMSGVVWLAGWINVQLIMRFWLVNKT